MKVPLDSLRGDLCPYRWAVRCGGVVWMERMGPSRIEHAGPVLSSCCSSLVRGLWWGVGRRKAGEALEGHRAPELVRVVWLAEQHTKPVSC